MFYSVYYYFTWNSINCINFISCFHRIMNMIRDFKINSIDWVKKIHEKWNKKQGAIHLKFTIRIACLVWVHKLLFTTSLFMRMKEKDRVMMTGKDRVRDWGGDNESERENGRKIGRERERENRTKAKARERKKETKLPTGKKGSASTQLTWLYVCFGKESMNYKPQFFRFK